MGFSLMFKLDESSVVNHINDRKVRILEEDIAAQVRVTFLRFFKKKNLHDFFPSHSEKDKLIFYKDASIFLKI